MFFPKLLDGGDGQSRNIFFLLIGQVRHAIQYVQPGICFADELQHFFLEEVGEDFRALVIGFQTDCRNSRGL